MKTRQEDTEQRIIRTAVTVFFGRGIKRTSMDDIALESGLTRVTVYRYFADKKELVRAVFQQVNRVIEDTFERTAQGSTEVEEMLDCILTGFSNLPKGDLNERVEELRRVYPDVWSEFNDRYMEAVKRNFQTMLVTAEQQGCLRPGLNRDVVQAYFMTAVLDVIQNPDWVRSGLSREDVFATVKAIFLGGIMLPEAMRG
jgi:AcrR family transcriptional regulator